MPEPGTADPDRAALDLLLRGFQVSRMLRLAADLGVADRIALDGNTAVEELAAACGVHPQPLIRVLRALAAFGVFRVTANGRVAHTPRSHLLRTDVPASMHHAARFWTEPGSWKAWGELDVALTGGVPYEAAWGMARFDHLRANPDTARIFDAMMAHFPDGRHAAVATAYDFSGARLICDVGGGNGTMLRHILARFPEPKGLVFDLEDVVGAIPPERLMEGRIAVAPGSFFEGVPAGADLYMLMRVVHDWSDEDCLRILRACRAAMGPGALLLIGEQLLDPDPALGRPTDYLLDMQMMAIFGSARSRTEEEHRALLRQSDLELRRVVPTASPISILEAAAM